jgi:beta-glucanase (GH16 family)
MRSALLSLLLPSLVQAWGAPGYNGYNLLWQETFAGASGSPPMDYNWFRITNLHVNNEVQEYTTDLRNMQLSGGSTLQIVPWRDAYGRWTSGRIESKGTFTPAPGRVTFAEAAIRFGDSPTNHKQGIWPAFWLLGDAIRRGTGWPLCGEIDILETVNGQTTGYGTVHCGTYPGGPCNEPSGLSGSTGFGDQGWHTWRVAFDLTSGDWRSQSINWYLDGRLFSSVPGSRVGDEGIWSTLAHSPLFVILVSFTL